MTIRDIQEDIWDFQQKNIKDINSEKFLLLIISKIGELSASESNESLGHKNRSLSKEGMGDALGSALSYLFLYASKRGIDLEEALLRRRDVFKQRLLLGYYKEILRDDNIIFRRGW